MFLINCCDDLNDEIIKLVLESCVYLDFDNTFEFNEALKSFIKSNPSNVGKIIKEILDKNDKYDHCSFRDFINDLLEELINIKENVLAREIENGLLLKGIDLKK